MSNRDREDPPIPGGRLMALFVIAFMLIMVLAHCPAVPRLGPHMEAQPSTQMIAAGVEALGGAASDISADQLVEEIWRAMAEAHDRT